MKRLMTRILVGLAALLVLLLFQNFLPREQSEHVSRDSAPAPPVTPAPASGVIEAAFRNRSDNIPVSGTGTVFKMLPDDNNGARHQRFLMHLPSGHTLLIAHNIDIAPRITSLREGDQVTFFGLYEWNEKGGVVHWTHHDPGGRYSGGYLVHNGMTYQ